MTASTYNSLWESVQVIWRVHSIWGKKNRRNKDPTPHVILLSLKPCFCILWSLILCFDLNLEHHPQALCFVIASSDNIWILSGGKSSEEIEQMCLWLLLWKSWVWAEDQKEALLESNGVKDAQKLMQSNEFTGWSKGMGRKWPGVWCPQWREHLHSGGKKQVWDWDLGASSKLAHKSILTWQ